MRGSNVVKRLTHDALLFGELAVDQIAGHSYVSYDSLRALVAEKHLSHFRDDVLEEYEELAEDAE